MFHKTKKSARGFTLVEVIVVAVIVAVLAAVAIPLYMGYIRDSRIQVGDNIAGTICSAAGSSTQQEIPFAVQAGPGPFQITFLNKDGTTPNVISIPADYTVAWVDGGPGTPQGGPATVEVYWTTYLQGTGKVCTYKQ